MVVLHLLQLFLAFFVLAYSAQYRSWGFIVFHQIVTIGFIGEDKAIEVEEFFKTNPVPTAERVIRQSLEAIRNNTQWLKRDQDSIREWLKNEAQS